MPKLPRFLDKSDPLEKKIEAAVCRYAETMYGIKSRKYVNPSHRAAPDRIFFINGDETLIGGIVFFIEFKRKGVLPTEAQNKEHDLLRRMGFDVGVVDNVEFGKSYILQIAKKYRIRKLC